MDDKFLSVKEAAKKYGVKECTLRSWIRRGELPSYRFHSIRRTRKRGTVAVTFAQK